MDDRPGRLLDQARERFDLHDYHGAVLQLEELIAGGRGFADAHHLLGVSYHLVGQSDRALQALDEALSRNPDYVEALIHRGIILGELGRGEEAQEAFDRAERVGGQERDGIPSHHASKLANLHANLGEAYVESGALGRAIEQYQQALRLGPAFHDLRFRLGKLMLDAGRSLEARDVLEAVVEARPGLVAAKASLGLAAYLSGDPQSAQTIWEAAHQAHPDDPRITAYLALLTRAEQA
ncbi:MAG: tetratricopeptide repeat protein [Gemmatimonadales bacterium]